MSLRSMQPAKSSGFRSGWSNVSVLFVLEWNLYSYWSGPIDENTDRMAMSACSYFKTLCPILFWLPRPTSGEGWISCVLLAWVFTAGRPVQGGQGVCRTRSLCKQLEPDPQLEMKSTSLGSAGSCLRFNVQLLRKEYIYFLNDVCTSRGIRLSF